METLYGESPEIQMDDGYDANNGIAVYSAGDGDDETITGGSGDSGSYPTSSRIFWTITRVEDPSQPGSYSYSGGISGVSWFKDEQTSPFNDTRYDEPNEIWAIASASGNLNVIFDEWNADSSNEGERKRAYFMYYLSLNAPDCSRTLGG